MKASLLSLPLQLGSNIPSWSRHPPFQYSLHTCSYFSLAHHTPSGQTASPLSACLKHSSLPLLLKAFSDFSAKGHRNPSGLGFFLPMVLSTSCYHLCSGLAPASRPQSLGQGAHLTPTPLSTSPAPAQVLSAWPIRPNSTSLSAHMKEYEL